MANKKKLLFVNGHLNVGGGEKSLIDLLQHLDYSEYDVDLLLVEGLGEYYKYIPSEVRVIYVCLADAYGAFGYTLLKNLRKCQFGLIWYRIILILTHVFSKKILCLVRPVIQLSEKYDCAIAYRPGVCADIVAYVAMAKKKICWWHNGKCDYTKQQIDEVDSTWEDIDLLVSVSEGCKRLITSNFTIPASKIVVIPNMIDIAYIVEKAGKDNPYSDFAEIRIITVCRLSEEKHLENAIYVMSALTAKNQNHGLCWYIIGDGPQRSYLTSLIEQFHLGKSVILLGEKTNPYPYIKNANIYVSTSYQESQSISVLEAMALRIPCVVTSTIGTDGYCLDGINSFVTEPNEKSLLSGVQKMLTKQGNLEQMVQNACQMVGHNFSPSTIMNQVSSNLV